MPNVCLIGENKGCVPNGTEPEKVHAPNTRSVDCITKAMLKNNSGVDADVEIWITNEGEAVEDGVNSCNRFGCITLFEKGADCVPIECLIGENLEPGQCIWMRSSQPGIAFRLNYKKISL